MKIGDTVCIKDVMKRYPSNIVGYLAKIMEIYGTKKKSYALKISGIENPQSKYGYFYLPEECLCPPVCAPIGMPVSQTLSSEVLHHLILNKAFARTISIKKVIFNRPATIVLWGDGTKTVVKKQKGDRWDPEKGLAMCIIKKLSGNEGSYYNIFKRYCKDE